MDKQRADGIFSGSIRWAARSPAPDATPPPPPAPVPSLHRLARLQGSAAPLVLAALLLAAAVTAAPASAQTPPGTISDLTGTPGHGQVTLAWTSPNLGSKILTVYQLKKKTGTGSYDSTWTTVSPWQIRGTKHQTHVTGLANGTAYTFKIRVAFLDGSHGPVSNEVRVTPATVPGTISDLTATPGHGQVTLAWTSPNLGSKILTVYQLKKKTGTGSYDSTWTTVSPWQIRGTKHQTHVTGLANGTAYTFKIRVAFLDGSHGPVSNEVRVTPATVPGTISDLTATPGHGQVTLAWSLPGTGGSAITKFQSRRKIGAAAYGNWTDIPSSGTATTDHTVTGLTNGTAYTFKVRAVNNVGDAPDSNEVRVTPATVPGTISDLSAEAGHRRVTLAWTVPGGGAITEFQYRGKAGSGAYGNWAKIPESGAGTKSYTVTALSDGTLLTNGTSYTFQVRAVNGSGGAAPSSPVSATPAERGPGDIRDLSAAPGDRQVTLTWTVNDRGSPITQYEYRRRYHGIGGLKNSWHGWEDITSYVKDKGGGKREYTKYAMNNGQTWDFEVRMRNRFSVTQPVSNEVTATPVASSGQQPPSPPTDRTPNPPSSPPTDQPSSPPTDQPSSPQPNQPSSPPTDQLTNAAPAFSSAAEVSAAENQRAVLTVRAVEPDAQDGAVRYRLSGGADQARFALDPATGALSFVAGPDYEHPLDAGGNNDYVVTVQATSGTGERERSAEQTIAVTVTDVAEAVIGPRATSAWLARVGRTVTDQVLDAVAGRLAAPRAPGVEVRLAGQALPAWSWEPEEPGTEEPAVGEPRGAGAALRPWRSGAARAAPGRNAPAGGVGPETRARTGRDLVAGTAFTLTGAPQAHGLVPSVWGRGALTRFDGRDGPLTLDGEAATGLLGADWAGQHWTAGVALGHSRVTGGYRASAATGTIEAALTGVYPYVGWDLTERLTGWAAAGYGGGEFTLTPPGGGTIETDLTLAMGATGLRGAVLQPSAAGGLALAVKSDVRVTRTSAPAAMAAGAGRLRATTADVWRLRAGVEGTRPVTLNDAGATLTPSFEVGARLDGGDAETGVGADVGGGLALADPTRGLHLALKARALLVHEAQGFREWGASAAVGWDPQPATEQGLALALTQAWGGAPAGGMDALLARDTLAGLAGAAPARVGAGRLTAELGYGLAVLDGAFTGISTAGLTLTPTGRDYRLGWRLTPTRPAAPGVVVHLDATRSETRGTAPAHAVMLRGDLRF